MIKMLAFLYNRHKKDKRVNDIAHLQTFGDLLLIIMLPFFLLLKLFNLDVIDFLRNIATSKLVEYALGTMVILIFYAIFYFIFPPSLLDQKFKEYYYDKHFLLYLRIIWFSMAAISLALVI